MSRTTITGADMGPNGGARPKPTLMGARIIGLMKVNGLENFSQFAEQVLGISRQRFHAWLYKDLRGVEAKPLVRCAEALHTSPNYLMGLTHDPAPETALEGRERELIEAFRSLLPADQAKLLKIANDWVETSPLPPSAAAPFRKAGGEKRIAHRKRPR